jgi:hypothetical membrane protein
VEPEPFLVPRAVHRGGLLLIVAVVQFLAAMIILQVGYPGYSILHNYISDLGNTHLSPWWPLFSATNIVFGALVIAAVIEMRASLRPGPARTVGLALLALAAIGVISVGFNPEDVRARIHVLSAGIAFIGGNIALIVLAIAMHGRDRWNGFRVFSAALGVVGLVALGLLETGHVGALGVGGMERLAAFPLVVWGLVVGIHLVRLPTVAPPRHHELQKQVPA